MTDISRREAFGIAVGGIAALSLGGATIYVMNERARVAQENLLKQIANHPQHGRIAYAQDNEIHILDASTILEDTTPLEKFQVDQAVRKLSWSSDTSILFIAKAHDANELGTPEDPDRRFDYSIVSEGLFSLDTNSGEVTLLFDPYSEAAKEHFGDIAQKDANKEKELEAMMNTEESGIRIVMGDHSNLKIQDMHGTPDGLTYVKIERDWYLVSADMKLEKAKRIPTAFSNQQNSKDGLFKLVVGDSSNASISESMDGKSPLRITDLEESATGLTLAEHASCAPAWFQK